MGQAIQTADAIKAKVGQGIAAGDTASKAVEKEVEDAVRNFDKLLDGKTEEGLTKIYEDEPFRSTSAAVIKTHVFKRINVTSSQSDYLTDALDQIVGQSFLKASTIILKGLLNSFLGNAPYGTSEKMVTRQIWTEEAMLDLRCYLFRIKMTTVNLKTNIQDGLVVVVAKHVLMLSDVRSTEAIRYGLKGQFDQAIDVLEREIRDTNTASMQLNFFPKSLETLKYWLNRHRHYQVDESNFNQGKLIPEKMDEVIKGFQQHFSESIDEKESQLKKLKKDETLQSALEKLTSIYQEVARMKAIYNDKRRELISESLKQSTELLKNKSDSNLKTIEREKEKEDAKKYKDGKDVTKKDEDENGQSPTRTADI